tara:strand:- start:1065 stop:1934 length:870 start_codon:yes stop_codon:yes gene_type:complete
MLYKLKKGDNVKVIAPSSFIDDEKDFLDGLKIIEDWGLNINHDLLNKRKFGYFSENDLNRSIEVEKAQSYDLIICAKGGWGASRVLEKDPKWRNKWLLGFSDNCSLLLSKYSKNSIGSIHGPTISTLSREPTWSIYRLKNFLFDGNLDDICGKPLVGGQSQGEIIVSNLTIFCFLIGTSNLPDCNGKIIIFEDINEDIYKIDRMFTYLRMSKVLDNIVGIGFGNFFCKNDSFRENLLENLILDRFQEFNIPIVSNFPIGHIRGNAMIPIGFRGKLNGNNGNLSIDINFS